ncbi:hypothetical protein GM921_02000 [Pedobacter sp. LMG 31464]|uniref:LTXXQ motif family protein n=1 Tax=Pedobacter planticolens TaxID=2679964 RepID=A0A923DUR6_9SPHI|nr:Spy/CpxP family protein refolding chaperone [Pedobacter planticolens]MBB2144246.1 hypothetical protein [Pedobacter planticolens]
MKKLALSLVLVAGLAFGASAQQGGQQRRMMSPEDRVKQLDEKVKLTDDQKTKATEVYTAAAAEQKKMMEEMQAAGGTPDRAAMQEKRTKMTADLDAKVNAILTDDQKKAYKTWQEEMKAAREKAMKERQGGGGK